MAGMASSHHISRFVSHHVSVSELSVENKVQILFIVSRISVDEVSVAVDYGSDIVSGFHSAFKLKGFHSSISNFVQMVVGCKVMC